jgi:hypothetical protein
MEEQKHEKEKKKKKTDLKVSKGSYFRHCVWGG